MKRIYNSDIRLDITNLNLPATYDMKFYTCSADTYMSKDEGDAYEISGRTYVALDWSMLQLLGEGPLSFILTKHIPDEEFPDQTYDTTVRRVTNYYIQTSVTPVPSGESGSTLEVIIGIIENYTDDMRMLVSGETVDRMVADQDIEDALSALTGRVEDLEGIDLSGYATQVQLESGVTDAKNYAGERDAIVLATAKLYSDTNTIDMATKTWVEGQGYLKDHQDLSGYLTRSDYNVDQKNMASKNWTQDYLEDEGYATKDYVQSAIEGGVDLSNYYTKEQIDAREWTGTKEEYDALSAKSDNITYFIISGTTA